VGEDVGDPATDDASGPGDGQGRELVGAHHLSLVTESSAQVVVMATTSALDRYLGAPVRL
jgi:hypothetical protein